MLKLWTYIYILTLTDLGTTWKTKQSINTNNEPIKVKLTEFGVIDNTVLLKMNLHSKPRYGIDYHDTDSVVSYA